MADDNETRDRQRKADDADSPARKRGETSPAEDRPAPQPPGGGIPIAEAQELVRRSAQSAAELQRSAVARAAGTAPTTPVTASSADITDELSRGGPAFGAFISAVGLALADTQSKLDQTLIATADAFCKAEINVIATYDQEIDDNGEMTAGHAHMQKLPLINYLMPTAYQWTRVYLEADMKVKEFNSANGFNIQSSSTTVGANANTSGLSGALGLGFDFKTSASSGGSSTSTDEAAGSMHMEATLEPRPDVTLPQPFIIQKGPRLKVTAGSRADILDTSDPPRPVGSRMTLTAVLLDKANNPLSGKTLDVRISDPLLDFSMTPANGQTDATGQLQIEVRREGAAFDPTKPSSAVTVNVFLGLINQQVVVNI